METHPGDTTRGLLMRLKANLGQAGNLAFRFRHRVLDRGNEGPYLEFEPDPVDVLPGDVGSPEKAQQKSEREEAKDFLRAALANGPRPSNDVIREAAELGISRRTLNRARAELRIILEKQGMDTGWLIGLPGQP